MVCFVYLRANREGNGRYYCSSLFLHFGDTARISYVRASYSSVLFQGNYSFDCEMNFQLFNMELREQKSDKNETVTFYGQYKVEQTYYRQDRRVGCIFVIVKYQPSESKVFSPLEI